MDVAKRRHLKTNVAVFLAVWVIIGFQVAWCEESRHQICVTSNDTQVNVTCPGISDRIFIRRVRYSRLSSFPECNSTQQKPICSFEFDETKAKPEELMRACSGQHHCSLNGDYSRQRCLVQGNGKMTNYTRIGYDCVQELQHGAYENTIFGHATGNELVNLCGSDNRNITKSTHLAVFPKPGDGSLDCRCKVSGRRHVTRVIHVELPNAIRTENCSGASLRVTWDNGSRTLADGIFLRSGDIPGKKQSTTWTKIRLVRDCNNSYTPVWLQIIPATQGKKTLTLVCKRATPLLPTQCGYAVTDIPSKPTDAASETNAGGIAGAFVGGVALGICLAVIGVIIVWRQRTKEIAEPNFAKQSKGLPRASRSLPAYEEVAGGGVSVDKDVGNVADRPTCTNGEEADYGGYHSIRETNEAVKSGNRQPRGLVDKGDYDTFGAPLKSAPNSVAVYNVYGDSQGNGSSGYHVLETVRLPDAKGASDIPSYKGSDVNDGIGTPQESRESVLGDYHVFDKLSQPEIPPERTETPTTSDSCDGKRPARAGDYDHIDHIISTSNALEKL